jgi:hypothetical protein
MVHVAQWDCVVCAREMEICVAVCGEGSCCYYGAGFIAAVEGELVVWTCGAVVQYFLRLIGLGRGGTFVSGFCTKRERPSSPFPGPTRMMSSFKVGETCPLWFLCSWSL